MNIETILTSVKKKAVIESEDFNDVINNIILGNISLISKEIDRDLFQKGTYTEVWSESPILLKNTPITEVTKVEKRVGGDYVDITSDVLYDENTGEIGLSFAKSLGKIKVTYTGGIDIFAEEHLLLLQLIERLTLRQWNKTENEGKSSTQFKDSTINWHNLLTPEDKMILDQYRHIWL